MRRPLLLLLPLLLLGASPADPLATELDQGQQAFDRGDHAAAIVHWALAVKAARDAGDRPAELDALLRLASAYREAGQLGGATALLDEADALASEAVGQGRVLTARGLVLLDQGDPRGAEKALRKAFEQHQGAKDPQGAANAASNLGLALLAQGRHADARKAFEAADRLFAALGDRRGRADALVNLAISSRHQGALGDARSRLEEALRIYRDLGDAGGEADALANLGLVLQDLWAEDAARELYESALATARSRKDVGRQAVLLQNLGTLEHRAGNADVAGKHYAAAEEAFTAAGQPGAAASVALDRALLTGDAGAMAAVLERAKKAGDRRLEAIAAVNLAAAVVDEDPAAALKHLGRAGALADQLELGGVRWRVSYLSGRAELARGREAKGIEWLEAAVAELERTRLRLGGADAERFVAGHEDVYRALIDARLDAGDAEGAMVWAERMRIADLPLPVPEEPRVARVRELEAEEAWVEAALADELARGPEGAPSERADALREQLAALRIEFARTVDELRATYPAFDQAVRVDPEDLEAIQGDLEPGVVVLQPILLDDRLALLVFRNDRVVARTVAVDGREVEAAVDGLIADLRRGNVYEPRKTRATCDELGEWLLAPVARDLEGASVVVVAADGVFRQLPFGMLRTSGQYLVERAAVVGVTHVGSLRKRATVEPPFRLDGPGLLLLGNPDGSLPGAEAEVGQIASRFPGATVLVGEQGSREALYAAAAGKRAVHLATHGTIDPERPDRSWLTVADASGEGRLAYGEIPGLAPYLSSCRLVVLSACESGLPVKASAAGEVQVSINGLAAQFRRAGVETLVASMWRVHDAGTLKLMDGFYAGLGEGKDVATALRDAQRAMIADEEWAHPWYWGAFVVVGDWR